MVSTVLRDGVASRLRLKLVRYPVAWDLRVFVYLFVALHSDRNLTLAEFSSHTPVSNTVRMQKRRRIESAVGLLTAVRWDWRAAKSAVPPSTAWGSAGSSASVQYANSLLAACTAAIQKKKEAAASSSETQERVAVNNHWIKSSQDVWTLVEKAERASKAPEGSQWYGM